MLRTASISGAWPYEFSVVFLHGDIASMMQPMLNAPMTARQFEESFGISHIPR